jgi:actin-like ATPase involved in cell morphogenesis
MSESLGLSIGLANLVAARVGSAPVTRSSVLTLFEHRPTEVGLPEENPKLIEPGLVLRGFVERVGDRAPLVAADGTKYSGASLTVEAVEAMARTVGYGTPVTIAVPAYWSEAQATALREEFFAQTDLARRGVPPVLISDATAALAALRAAPGFPTNGVIALCDFGAGGTSITLTNASNFQQIGSSTRYTDFAGDAIDSLILDHVRTAASDVTTADLAGTARIGAQTRLLGECRRAKERLSAATVATIPTGSGGDISLSRTEFDQLISGPTDRFVDAVENTLQRNGIQPSHLAAVAMVGGGAGIPLLTTRLASRLRAPIHTTPQPAFGAAIGAALLGEQPASGGVATAASPRIETPTELVETARVAGADPPVAWSQDADEAAEPVPYTGPDMTGEYGREAAGSGDADSDRYAAAPARLPWYKRTALVLSVVGAAAAVLVAVVLALTLGHSKTNPVHVTPPNEPPQTSQTVTITGPNDTTTVTVIPPPPSSSEPAPTTTTSQPAPTTTTTTAPTTTTSAAPTTTSQASTTAPTTTRQRPVLPLPGREFPR